MYCTNHPQTLAAGVCVRCGRPFCQDCLGEVNGVFYCREHINDAYLAERHGRIVTQTVFENRISPHPAAGYGYPYKSRLTALLFCLFLGIFGIHRFYVGKIGTGLIWFFTGGFFGIGWLLDLLCILFGFFRDKAGYPLV
jgi:hypothetical protein